MGKDDLANKPVNIREKNCCRTDWKASKRTSFAGSTLYPRPKYFCRRLS
jgi:hypothetical protein